MIRKPKFLRRFGALLAALTVCGAAMAQVAGPVQVGFDEYAFQYVPSPNIGLFFSGTDNRYELRDASSGPAFWLNPQAGRSYFRGRMGINIEVPLASLDVAGDARIGSSTNHAAIATDGDLRFAGTADYLVGNNRYAFRSQGDQDYGLFFNATDNRYQFLGDGGVSAVDFSADGGFFRAYDADGEEMFSHNGNTFTVASLGASSGLTLEGSDATTQVRIRMNNNMPGGQNYILQSTANGVPVGGGKFSIRNENRGENVFVIDSVGRFGFGLENPEARLDVNGAVKLGTTLGSVAEGMVRWTGSDFEGYDGSSWLSLTGEGNQAWSDATLSAHSYRTGKVSIGTTVSFPDDQVLIRNNDLLANNPLRVQVGTSTKFYVTNTGGVSVGSSHDTPPTDGMYVKGDVTIGTQTPAVGYALSVNGKAIVEELTVEMSGDWPDYVFTPEHSRPALPELKQAIAELGHLPGVPSADAVAEHGIHVGEMQTTLLEKVEELTLYIIELEERLAEVEGNAAGH